jgi:hypothetical protein
MSHCVKAVETDRASAGPSYEVFEGSVIYGDIESCRLVRVLPDNEVGGAELM